MTSKGLCLSIVVALAVMAGCAASGGSAVRSPTRPSATVEAKAAPAAEPESQAEASYSDEAPAPSSAAESDAAWGESQDGQVLEDAPAFSQRKQRPGLGTEWGETRYSRVSSAPFYRASETPFAVDAVHYNDEAGIRAMLGGTPWRHTRAELSMAGGMVTVSIVDGGGRPLPSAKSGARTYVVGEDGDRYAIRLQNHSRYRVEIVATVDGLDVLDGQPGSYAKRGYLLQPYGNLTIDGYRQSMEEVAAFRFGSVRRSYAARKGDDRNVGVIGVALFSEAGQPTPWTSEEVRLR